MKLSISKEAAAYLKKELGLNEGDGLRFHAKVYGESIHPGYSIGMMKQRPSYLSHHTYSEGILFFFEQQDDWFLQDHRMEVVLNGEQDIDYLFKREDDSA